VPAYLVCTLPDSQAPSPAAPNDNVVVNVGVEEEWQLLAIPVLQGQICSQAVEEEVT
jgi:hypothetical protein